MARQYHRFTKDSDAVADDQENHIFNCEETELQALKDAQVGFTWVELVADADVPDPA
tara:strand:- start:33 stop:203 length:171 start_codon:yes stop_codon:yes gene_type:complete